MHILVDLAKGRELIVLVLRVKRALIRLNAPLAWSLKHLLLELVKLISLVELPLVRPLAVG